MFEYVIKETIKHLQYLQLGGDKLGLLLLLGQLFDGDYAVLFLSIHIGGTILVTLSFHFINKKFLQYKNRNGLIAFILSASFTGSGFAYSGAYVRGWLFAISSVATLGYALATKTDEFGYAYVIINIVQAIWAPLYAVDASYKLREKSKKDRQKSIEDTYLQGLLSYIHSGYHVAVDTNFLMHFSPVLLNLYKNTNVHLFLHPTVFGELEGLKGNNKKEVRQRAQGAFDILELYQKSNRMQWTRRQKQGSNFKSADQRIITGVLNEIQSGVKLVFASHDKGARILARSLHIPVVDPNENYKDTVHKVKS